MSEQRIDSGAEAATTGHPDEGDGPDLPSAPPSSGGPEDVPATEGARHLVETISRLEESNE